MAFVPVWHFVNPEAVEGYVDEVVLDTIRGGGALQVPAGFALARKHQEGRRDHGEPLHGCLLLLYLS